MLTQMWLSAIVLAGGTKMELGYMIKAARKAAKLTQAELAEKAGIAINSLRLYEGGKRQPRIEQLQHIADALGVPITDFLLQTPREEVITMPIALCKMQDVLKESELAGDIEISEAICLQQILSALEMQQNGNISFGDMIYQINHAISLFNQNPFNKLDAERELYAQLNSRGRDKLGSYLQDLVKIRDYTISGP